MLVVKDIVNGAIKVWNGFNGAISFIRNLPSEAIGWGSDFIHGLQSGIMNAVSGITNAVSNVASSIRSILHFSTPDEGPLKDYEFWMPDFMGGLAKGIQKSKNVVTSAIKSLATDVNIGMKLAPVTAPTATSTIGSTANRGQEKQQGNTVINFNGSYTFADKKDINYFMNQVALLVQRKK